MLGPKIEFEARSPSRIRTPRLQCTPAYNTALLAALSSDTQITRFMPQTHLRTGYATGGISSALKPAASPNTGICNCACRLQPSQQPRGRLSQFAELRVAQMRHKDLRRAFDPFWRTHNPLPGKPASDGGFDSFPVPGSASNHDEPAESNQCLAKMRHPPMATAVPGATWRSAALLALSSDASK